MMFLDLSYESIRIICRNQIESFEYWARRFIHDQLSNKYGKDYIFYKYPDGNNLIKKELQDSVREMMQKHRARFTRPIDVFFLEDIIYILCKKDLYESLFKSVFNLCYPNGSNDLRNYLTRLIPIRNNLSHANPISVRQAEQAVCYTNDFIDCLKDYYKKENLFMDYNVPQITKVIDSFGQERYRDSIYNQTYFGLIWNRSDIDNLRPGDSYRIDIEIDSSFDESDYEIQWYINETKIKDFHNKKYFSIMFDISHVAEHSTIDCKIISKKSWHKHTYFDDRFSVILKILPPLNE